MKIWKYPITLFVSLLTITATIQKSFAIRIIPSQPYATQNWRRSSDYPVPGSPTRRNTVEVDTRLWTQPLPLGGSQSFKNALTWWSLFSDRGFFGWDFQVSGEPDIGSFEIEDYVACGFNDVCGGERPYDPTFEPRVDGIGVNFRLKYTAPTAPPPGQSHWIQVARASYASVGAPTLISGIWFLDNAFQSDSPYADEANPGAITPTLFRDMPHVDGNDYPSILAKNNYFEAHLYLVREVTNPNSSQRKVTIYDGIQWGFKNIEGYKRVEDSPPPPPPPRRPRPNPISCADLGSCLPPSSSNCLVNGTLCTITYEAVADFDNLDFESGFCHYNWYENGWNFEGCLLDSRDWKVTATTSFVYNGLNSIPSPPSELDDYLVNDWRIVQIGNFSSNRIQIQSMELNLNINSDDVSVSTKSVPESNHVFGVIAIFAWNAILWLKKRKD